MDAEDHNVYIYYPLSMGGGSKRLFRKVGDRSSEFYPEINEVRTEGSYIYEEFVETQGTDVKVRPFPPSLPPSLPSFLPPFLAFKYSEIPSLSPSLPP